VQAGDSGGPLLDAEGEVVGMDTAASTGGAVQSYAIPIGTALDLAGQITAGVDDATVHQGLPTFLGVSVQAAGNGGAAVAGVVPGGPAATAGLAAGDVITSVGGTSVTAPEDLTTALSGADPGDQVSVTWTGTAGTGHSATVTLATGPAD
jgi:S1-C subfamily serine protease